MGFIVTVEADNGHKCPDWFTKTDSKSLATLLIEFNTYDNPTPPGPLDAIGNRFNLNLMPLEKIGGEGYPLEEYLAACSTREEAEREFQRQNEMNEAAWQSPDDLISCLEAVLTVLDSNPNVFSELKLSVNWQNSYVDKGFLYQDMKDLLHIINWHKADGAQKICLMVN